MSVLDEDFYWFDMAAFYDDELFRSMLLGFGRWCAPAFAGRAGHDEEATVRIIAAEAILGDVRIVREDTAAQLMGWEFPTNLN